MVLEEVDLDVLELLLDRPLYHPPPLVRGVLQELVPNGLTYFDDEHWHLTPYGRDVLAKHGRSRTIRDF